MLEEEAKERQRQAGASQVGNQYTGKKELVLSAELQQAPDETKGRAAEQAAAMVGASARSVYDLKKKRPLGIPGAFLVCGFWGLCVMRTARTQALKYCIVNTEILEAWVKGQGVDSIHYFGG